MVTKERLRQMLQGENAQEVARLSGMSSKTVYRLQKGHGSSPTLATVEAILSALAVVKRAKGS